MMRASCPREGDALRAVRMGTLEEELGLHLTECAVCGDIVQVSRWMQSLAEGPDRTDALPDAGLLWWRARLSEKQTKMEQAEKILGWTEFVFATFLFAGLAGWMCWHWNVIQKTLTSFLAGGEQQVWGTVLSVAGATPILSSFGVVILSMLAIGLVYPLLARD
jgi:hypothetical protein